MQSILVLTVVLGLFSVEGVPSRNIRCSNPVGSLDGRILVESEYGEISDFTTVQWQIRLGETVCYRFKSESPNKLRGYIEVTYKTVRTVYSISNHYYFRLAKSEVECRCDCPGGSNFCNTYTNSCSGKLNCINYYSSSQTSYGCFFKFLKLSSALCCSIAVDRLEDNENMRYRAVELSVPNVVAELYVVHRDETYAVVDSRTYHVDLNSGTSVDWEVSLQLSGAGPTNFVPPGWYMAPEMSHRLYGNLPINGLDEWDIYKLGWFKSKRDKDHIDSTGHQLRRAFDVQVSDCMENSHRVEFSTAFINGDQLKSAQRVDSMYPFVDSIQVWRRTVEVIHRESPLIVLTLQHRNKVGVVMQYHESALGDFDGYVLVDRSSNQFLYLNLTGAKGSIRGKVSTEPSSSSSHSLKNQVIYITVDGNSTSFAKRIKLRGGLLCDGTNSVVVSLAPVRSRPEITKILPCLEDNLRDFDSFWAERSSGFAYAECSTCTDSWAFWANPLNWGKDIWSLSRVLVTAIIVLSVLSFVAAIVKLFCCCCCSKTKSIKK